MNNIDQFFISNIKEFVPSWRHLESGDLRITKTIGITNKTYIIEADAEPPKIIFRHFGEVGVGLFLDREQELQIAQQVARCKMGPHFYGHTAHVRLEEYLENEEMSQEAMKDQETYTLVAQTLSKFHQIDISQQMSDKQPLFEKHLANNSDFLMQVRRKFVSDCFSKDEKAVLENMANWFSEEEVQFLREILPKDDIVFSHNDLLANNILLIPPYFDKVVFIDFEYSSYNFRGFDIANYFNESQFSYVNPNPPYFYIEEGMVPEQILKDFVKVYIEESKLNLDYNTLLHQVYIGQLFSHFFWAAWGIIMAKSNDIVFDYLSFVEARYQKYYQLKKHLFGKK